MLCCCFFRTTAQTSDHLRRSFTDHGFENIRVLQQDTTWIITLENNVYRWQVDALSAAMGIISGELPESSRVKVIFLDKDVPQFQVEFRNDAWKKFREGELPPGAMPEKLMVTEAVKEEWLKVRKQKAQNLSAGKIDLVIHPQLSFENTLKARLYTGQFNIAPAVEVTLFRGLHFTGQVIFPLYNELGREGDFIRPGQLLLSQDFRFSRLQGRWAAGNFSNARYGGDLSLRYLLPDEHWCLKLNAGITGSSHFLEYQWQHSAVDQLTGSLSAAWFIPSWNLEAEGGVQRYIYGDAGLYGTVTRWFGETAFGFYAQLGQKNTNGGFRFCFPFPVKKQLRKRFFRIALPDHQEMIYNAGTEYYYGQSYRVGPGSNLVRGFSRSGYLKKEILKGIF